MVLMWLGGLSTMNPSEHGNTFCDTECFALIEENVEGRFTKIDDIFTFDLDPGIAIPGPLKVKRYLDRFFIICDPNRENSDIQAERVLFDAIAPEYNAEINASNNVGTANILLGMAGAERVIDLGCGTGLALKAPAAAQRELVGIDVSDQMLELARTAGMEAINLQDVEKLPVGGFDGLIACYALHLHGPRLALLEVIHLLGSKARIAANFHKAVGYSQVSASLTECGFELTRALHVVEGLASPVAMWERRE